MKHLAATGFLIVEVRGVMRGFLEFVEDGRVSIMRGLIIFEINEVNFINRKFLKIRMQKQRNSKSKINGKIIMMQNDLMSKLATL